MTERATPKKQSIRHPNELPPCKGPRLHVFPEHSSPIEWLGRIDGEDENIKGFSDSGKQGYVFKVRIDSQLYALKVVSTLARTKIHKTEGLGLDPALTS